MSWFSQSMTIAIACVLALGCNYSVDQSRPSVQQYKFMGIAEDEASNEGPVGLIGGKSIQVSNVSRVQEVPYSEYQKAIDSSKVVAQESNGGFVYWAVKEERDVRFENATAWVSVLERFKSRIELQGTPASR